MTQESQFTQEVVDVICEAIAMGRSLRKICSDEDMPAMSTVFKWLGADKAFSEQYARAREAQADTMADDILDIADDGRRDTYIDDDGNERTDNDAIARARLRVDSRKWLASKMAPKKYGDKQQIDINEITPKTPEQVDARIAELLAKATKRE